MSLMFLWPFDHCIVVIFSVFTFSLSTNRWHQRLGHPSAKILRQVLNLCNSSLNKSLKLCSVCQYGKSHVLPFSILETKTTSPLEIIYFDIKGQHQFLKVFRYRYYIHFVDNYTRFTWICPLKHKFEAIVASKQFKLLIEKSLKQVHAMFLN